MLLIIIDYNNSIELNSKIIAGLTEEKKLLIKELEDVKKALYKASDAYKSKKELLNSYHFATFFEDHISKIMESNDILTNSNRELIDTINKVKRFGKSLTDGSNCEIEMNRLIAENKALRKQIEIEKATADLIKKNANDNIKEDNMYKKDIDSYDPIDKGENDLC